MIRRTALIATSALLVVLGSAAVIQATAHNRAQLTEPPTEELFAQTTPTGRGGMRWLQDLNLSQDQIQRIQQIRSRDREQLSSDRDAVRQKQQELRQLMAGNASDEEIRRKYQEVKDIRVRLADAQFNSMLAMRNVLTLEQRKQFAERMERNRQNFRQRMRDRLPGQS